MVMIDPKQFDETLRQLIKTEKFEPFCVELDDGQRIWIRQPALAFGGGSASLIDSEDGALIGFSHKDVAGFKKQGQEIHL
jgi:hypothetical protein